MDIDAFDFHLPEELIAIRPARPRISARLLMSSPAANEDLHISDLPSVINPEDLLIFNDTKVIPARLSAIRTREKGESAKIEITLTEHHADGCWSAFLKPLRKVRAGDILKIGAAFAAKVETKSADSARLRFFAFGEDCAGENRSEAGFSAERFLEALDSYGHMPLPPYIAAQRKPDAKDTHDYQTIFAKHAGAIAAPTAALHFDKALLKKCLATGATSKTLTLHVGAGTFLPIRCKDIKAHKMHAEWAQIDAQTASAINATHANGGRVIAVGTTVLRAIETATDANGKTSAWCGKTDIFITPGYRFRAVDALITNFHLPKSTLIILIAAFVGYARAQQIYHHAIKNRYRFYSYGDSSLLIGAKKPLAKIKMPI